MKNNFLLAAVLLLSANTHAQTFISYGNNTITKQEFLKAYNKNKTTVSDKEKALREYVELYSNFKLKVKAAEELRLDTLPQIIYDINSFRDQIIENYLNDEKGIEKLTNEAFERAQKDLHIMHFSAAILPDASPEDTARIYKSVMDLYNTLKGGSADYNAMAQKYGPAIKHSDFGYVTVFTLPYEYENIIYNLKNGEVSKPYRSKNAWHLFKVANQRPSAGRWKISQILISTPEDASEEIKASALKRANEVYALLKNGDSFAETAKMYSDDRLSFQTGGELPEFGTGNYSAAFEKEVLQLKDDGEISKPFLTAFGYHIIKRMGYTPTPADDSDPAFMFDLKQKVLKDKRVDTEKEKFTKAIINKVGSSELKEVKKEDLLRFADSLMKAPTPENTKAFPISNKNVLKVKDQVLKGSDWLAFVREYKTNFAEYKGETNLQLWEKFRDISALNYYKKNLESYNPDFKFQMQEFKEGNMLFEIMERNVWGKAIADSAGLDNYYRKNKADFKWAASADVLIFNCTTAKVAEEAITALKKGKNWRTVSEEQGLSIQADSGRYELSQIIGANYASTPVKGAFTAIATNIDGTATFVQYVNTYPANEQRSFEEARGLVINEYQQELEQQWIADLKKKYPVRVNESMLKEML